MLTKQEKREQSEKVRAALSEVSTLFLLENTGLTVNDVNVLRSEVRKCEATYKVVKNSVVKMAVEGTDKAGLTPDLVGPKALAFTEGDGVALAKVLMEFIEKHPGLSFQSAYLEGQILETDAARQLADMPSKDQLISKLLYMLQSPIRRLAVALAGPTQHLASVLNQIADQRES